MEELDARISAFHLAYEKAWFAENKLQGFEIMDIRLGGLRQRVLSCKRRIEQYINGEISEIPKLREAVLEKQTAFSGQELLVTVESVFICRKSKNANNLAYKQSVKD